MRKSTVFISYSHDDSQFVDWLADQLKASGVDVWVDKWKIKVGDSITHKISEGIEASDWLIVVLSKASVISKWVREELNTATIRNIEDDKHAFILPVLLEECEIPTLLRHRKYANFKDDPAQSFQDLLEVIQSGVVPVFDRQPFEPGVVFVPAGGFLMGSDPEKDTYARKDEQPQHTVYLPDYYIAKTPVTNAQYLAFVEATGYKEPRLWTAKKPPKHEESHPVVYVSWYDTLAYCRWLSKVTSRTYRLPSEAEWEKAARGTDGRIYPWGDQWELSRCKSGWILPHGTTPVGEYSPTGDSPYCCSDMVGNVFQWCRSACKPYPYNPLNSREDPTEEDTLIIRGASWGSDESGLRCASRTTDYPDHWSWILGFRVVMAPDF